MKVVQITTSSRGGAGIAALRLHKALLKQGVACAFLSRDLSIDFNGNVHKDSFFDYKKPSFWSRVQRKLKLSLFPSKEDRLRQSLVRQEPNLKYEILTLPFSNYAVENHPLVQEADIVHLHWINGLINYRTFFYSVNKPLVWTLHDMNPFLGVFHYEEDDLRNKAYVAQVDRSIREIKNKALSNIEKGAVITPSKWLLEAACEHYIFKEFHIQRCIANAIDVQSYVPQDKNKLRSESSLGLSADGLVLLFTAGNLEIHRKGADLLIGALEQLSVSMTLLTVGEGEIKVENPLVKVIPLGFVSSDEEMAKYYALSDAFVLPSREDNLPNTMLESFSCGVPIISFAVGGMKECVVDGMNGYVSQEVSADSLATNIEKFYHNRSSFDSKKIRKFAEEHFHPEKQSGKYQNVYLELVNTTTPIH